MDDRQLELHQIRALANLTQKQTADLLHVHENTYLRIEKDPKRMTLEQAYILTRAAGVGVHQIKIR